MERDLMAQMYERLLPGMKKSGLEDTPKNRHAYLIGIRMAYVEQPAVRPEILEALTNEICRLGDNLPL